jgi:hypothetical protein
MQFWSLDLFCLKLCNVDKADLCRACPWTCFLYGSHFRLLRRSKESQSVKEAFFYPHLKISPVSASCQMLQILAQCDWKSYFVQKDKMSTLFKYILMRFCSSVAQCTSPLLLQSCVQLLETNIYSKCQ